jgi:hypothetical protein
MELNLGKTAVIDWLTDDRWIVLSFHGDFASHLEQLYFTPGTAKNDEFEIMVASVMAAGLDGIAPFYRIKDTIENRESLRAAIAEYTEERLLTSTELERNIQVFRQRVRATILPILR